MSTLDCRNCGARIRPEDIDVGRRLAKCAACKLQFAFVAEDVSDGDVAGLIPAVVARAEPGTALVPLAEPGLPVSPARERSPAALALPVPPRFRVRELTTTPRGGYRDNALPRAAELQIDWPWRAPYSAPLTVFAVFWDLFLIVFYAVAFASGMNALGLLFPLLHIAIGVALTYWTVAMHKNRTVIRLAPDALLVTHGPLRWRRAATIAAGDLVQLTRKPYEMKVFGTTYITYSLHAHLRSGGVRKLVSGLDDEEERFLTTQIEHAYGLVAHPVGAVLGR